MTKRDYTLAADEICQCYPGEPSTKRQADIRLGIINMFIRVFKRDNPAFNEDKFRDACIPEPSI